MIRPHISNIVLLQMFLSGQMYHIYHLLWRFSEEMDFTKNCGVSN